jgi:hypothetical protein
MSNTQQDFLADATLKAATDLEEALLRLPEDKRAWSPLEKGRTALDQVAECALLNGYMTELIVSHTMEGFDRAAYWQTKATLQQDQAATLSRLRESAAKATEAIRAVPDADIGIAIVLPFGPKPWTLSEIIARPSWNMYYHEAQINYIASLLNDPQ